VGARCQGGLPRFVGYGEGVNTGQSGAVPPFESVQLTRPSGNAFTTGLTGELAVM
jgi:hypothetical protein